MIKITRVCKGTDHMGNWSSYISMTPKELEHNHQIQQYDLIMKEIHKSRKYHHKDDLSEDEEDGRDRERKDRGRRA